MERPFDGVRRHSTTVDLSLAALVLTLCAVNIAVDPSLRGHDGALAVLLMLSLTLGVALRQRVPEGTLLLALLACLTQIVWENEALWAPSLAVYVIVCAVADRGAKWAARLALFGGIGATVFAAVRESRGAEGTAELVLGWSVPLTLAWALGYRARCRRCLGRQLAERAETAALMRSARREAALATQRIEIVREMYDITGQRVAGMVVQAEAADRMLDAAPGQARQALGAIASNGRESETDLRRTWGLLSPRD
ncbi:histidine kinase [Streptomyces sp. PT12]|uniref:DUF7134 domain-containing protein n=1 Tax=Streptomyces sp. PT12 TaxID=1510197 RepID=UPI000DE4D26F|nr:histidine kinase dimerization/phosphoacceptor domain-containing protein [Streptomyces sp. PT12]RBM07258.1 hypothetical protein DEH69_24670 [Streptomyces sp. PT12]